MSAIVSSLIVPSVCSLRSRPVPTQYECEMNALQLQLGARSAVALAIDAEVSVASTSYRLRKLVVIPSTATLSMTINILTANRILSAPVIRPDSTCAGVVDIASITFFLLRCSDAAPLHSVDDIAKMATLADVVSVNREYLFPFFQLNPLNVLLDVFASGVHRVTLMSESYELIAPCSQSDMISLLNKYCRCGRFPTVAAKSILSHVFHKQNMITASASSSLREVLQTLSDQYTSLVAIIDSKTGALVGDFSASDLRGLRSFDLLETNIVSYLRGQRAESLKPITVHLKDTIGDVLCLLAATRSHRVWIVDDASSPVLVLTATDVLRLFATGRTVGAREANGDVSVGALWTMLNAGLPNMICRLIAIDD